MAAYEYKVKGLVNAPAQAVGELFEQLQESKDGLTPQSVLNASRAEGTLLHDAFCWDDKEAAEKYRLTQAQFIIRNVIIVQETTNEEEEAEKPVRGFVSIPGGNSAYVAIESAMRDTEWRDHLMEQAKKDMEYFIAKYRRLQELAGVITVMEGIIKPK